LSKFDLIDQYKGDRRVLEILDKLNKKQKVTIEEPEQTNILQGYSNDKDSGQAYLSRGGFPSSTETNYTVYECYLRDDTIFQPEKQDTSDTEKVKRENLFKYPNGRLIVYIGDYILEDRAIDYPFGFPFATFTPTTTNTLVGYGDVRDLCATQDKLTNAYYKLNELVAKYRSMLIVSPDSINPNDLSKNFDIISAKRGSIQPPIQVTNKLSQDIQLMRDHINNLKRDALSLARINEVMLSGERPVGANSGQMIRDLNESPMSSIREIQRNFKSFLIDLMSEDQQNIEIFSPEQEPEMSVPQQFLNDLSITQYEIEIQTGSAMPQSQQAIAQTTMQLANQGVFGDVNSIFVKELILKSLDYPHYRAIIDKLKQEEEQMSQVPQEPQFEDYLKNVQISLKDIMAMISMMDPQSQFFAIDSVTNALGLAPPPPPPAPAPLPQDEQGLMEEDMQQQAIMDQVAPEEGMALNFS
jgi:ribosomal protein S15P/S13E